MYFAIKGQEKMFGHLYETEEEAGQSLDRLQHRMYDSALFAGAEIVEVEDPAGIMEIWQMKDEDWAHGHKFFHYKMAYSEGHVAKRFYNCVYREANTQEPGIRELGDLYRRFNCAHPEDFMAASMSVSDIVVFKKDGKSHAFFVEPIGFVEVPFE